VSKDSNLKSKMTSDANAKGTATGMAMIGSRPTLISVPPMKFLIMDAPRQSNLHLYIKEMKKNAVTDIVRVCEPTYTAGELVNAGMCLHELAYEDGHAPPKPIIDQWLHLVEKTFYCKDESPAPNKCIAIHCVAGLGRAPAMVALALIEFAKMDPVEAVTHIRQHRRGAINEKQLIYLEGYKPSFKKSGSPEGACCVIV
jgi:protein tyrosine phosphatase type 4A